MQKIAIIGAGISGLTLANSLREHAEVKVFEKSRGVGGRMSTRRADPFMFDHGAQYFTARTQAFIDFLAPHRKSGLVKEWQGKVITLGNGAQQTTRSEYDPYLVACPGMNSLCKYLAQNLTVHLGIEVMPLTKQKSGAWHLYDTLGSALGAFDAVISTAPPEQTTRLFSGYIDQNTTIRQSHMQPCFALMLGFEKPWWHNWMAAKVSGNPIEWISVNSTKPDRNDSIASLVVHSSHAWAMNHLEEPVDTIADMLGEELERITDIRLSAASYISVHRWKYAIADKSEHSGGYWNEAQGLGCVGDWSGASRIEDVWHHSKMLAEKIICLIQK